MCERYWTLPSARRLKRATSPSPWSSGPIRRSRDLSCCQSAGWLSGHSGGSTARDACQRTSRRRSNRRSHGCRPPLLSSSCDAWRGRKVRMGNFEPGSQKTRWFTCGSKSSVSGARLIPIFPNWLLLSTFNREQGNLE